jgi:hypothetical protein
LIRTRSSLRIKIQGGTVKHGQSSLCLSCRYATVVRGRRLKEEIVECDRLSAGHNLVRFPVTSCSGYLNRCHPSLREMEEIAWVLRTDAGKKHIGFVQSHRLEPRERFVLADDDWP